MMTKGIVFRYTWVYSKEDTMAHTHRLVLKIYQEVPIARHVSTIVGLELVLGVV